MSETPLGYLTMPLESFFDGASTTHSTLPWDPRQSRLFPRVSEITKAPNYFGNVVTWQYESPAATMTHVITCKQAYSHISEWPHALHLRMLCYLLLDRMPDEGLEETLSTLSEYLDFYSTSSSTPALSVAQEVPGTFIGVTDSPPLYIDEG